MLTHPSPNHNSRGSLDPIGIILHADASPAEKGTLSWIQASQSKVSYHALIGRDGAVYTCVPYDRRAWHAGKAEWLGYKDVNAITIGLCFANRNDGKEALTPAQMDGMKALIADVRRRYGHLPVTTHARVATPKGRKNDPEHIPNFRLEDYA
jgi:N-acetylmuramoyl-L-alanine amidase